MSLKIEMEKERNNSLPQDLFNKLRDDILQNKIKPGEKLTEHTTKAVQAATLRAAPC